MLTSYLMKSDGNRTVYLEQELLKKIAAGDEAAFKTVYERYYQKVYAYALQILKEEALAEDVLNEVFLKLWRREHTAKIEQLDAYLRVLTRNHTLNLLRKQRVAQQTTQVLSQQKEALHPDPEALYLFKETQQLLGEAISKLPPQQKLVYQLCQEEGLKYEEAAKLMSVSKLTVKTHMQLALRFLRKHLGKYPILLLFLFYR